MQKTQSISCRNQRYISYDCQKILEAVNRRCFMKKSFLKICKIHRKIPVSQSLFNKVAGFNFSKKRPRQLCFTFLSKQLHVTASVMVNFLSRKIDGHYYTFYTSLYIKIKFIFTWYIFTAIVTVTSLWANHFTSARVKILAFSTHSTGSWHHQCSKTSMFNLYDSLTGKPLLFYFIKFVCFRDVLDKLSFGV